MMGDDRRRAKPADNELLSWAKALLIAAPLAAGVWFVVRELPAPWDTAYPVLVLIPFLVIGILSKSNLWTLLVWLLPLIAIQVLFLAGVRGPVLVACSILGFVWVSGLMMFESFWVAISRPFNRLLQWIARAGLRREEREAYRTFLRASTRTAQEAQDAQQLQDVARTARGFRQPGLRIRALTPPNARWAEVFDAAAVAYLRASEMFESGEPVDYEVLNKLITRRQELIHQLLRDQSLPYRILTVVPGSLLQR